MIRIISELRNEHTDHCLEDDCRQCDRDYELIRFLGSPGMSPYARTMPALLAGHPKALAAIPDPRAAAERRAA